MSAGVRIAAAAPEHGPGLIQLFDACGSPCYCRYWHFAADSNTWLDRCAHAPERNRSELEDALARGADEARGVVAELEGAIIGWLKVAPAGVMAKAYARKPYRGLRCFERDPNGVFVIGCALVHPGHRHHGLATELVRGAVELAPAWGARVLEGFPRKLTDRGPDDDLWTGPFGAFTRNDFREVDAVGPYPVMRRQL
jgi:GNAT superfamily N-acetyltransferase